MFLITVFCFACIGICLCSCGVDNSNNDLPSIEKTAFTDSCGRNVQVDKDINKVIVTGPVSQQILLTFAPDKLCGLATNDNSKTYISDKYSTLPVFGQIYGGKGDFDREGLAACGAQIIIDVGQAKKSVAQDMDDLQKQLDITCVHIESSLETYDSVYSMLGSLLNMPEKGSEMAQYCNSKYSETISALSHVDKKRGIYVIGKNATNVVSKGSFHAGVIDLCTDNIAVSDSASTKGTGTETDMEQINLWNPDVIVFGADTDDVYNSVKTKSEWSNISAIKNNTYFKTPLVPYNWMSSPAGSNQILGLLWLSHELYPEAFSDSIQDLVTEYYKLFYNKDLSATDLAQLLS